ncbi:MAG: cation diffusion facilitator family transporter [Phycisphaerales bacterium]|nr:cation diffusion facilitator family transporter [Phycisphaerales bacterium]
MAQGSKMVIYAALVGNGLISITKFIAAGVTGSAAMFSEGIHSVVDTGNQVLLLYGIHRAKKPASPSHPFGHGKEIYFWSFVVAMLIFALGSGISIYEGIHRVLHPEPVTNPLVNYIVLGAAMIFEGFAWWFAYRAFRTQQGTRTLVDAVRASKDPIAFVVLFEDSAAMLGLVMAAIGLTLSQVLELPVFDGMASISIGLILGFTAVLLALRTKSLLIGESADPALVEDVRKRASELEAVVAVNEVLTLHMGPNFVLLNVSVDLKDSLPAGKIEEAIDLLTREIRETHPDIKRVFIEAESRKTHALRSP